MRTNQNQIFWNPRGENIDCGFYCIYFSDEIGIIEDVITKERFTVNYKKEKEKLHQGKPCLSTDNRYRDIKKLSRFYGENCILMAKRDDHLTLGQILKKIKKIEHLFPIETKIDIHNTWYGTRVDNSTYGFGLTYVTKRKFKGFKEDFEVNKFSYFDNFDNDKLGAQLVTFFRENGFLVKIDENNEYDYSKDIMHPTIIKERKLAIAYGHNFMVGFSEFDDDLYGYGSGRKFILFDKIGHFDKWSKCEQIIKPTSVEQFPDILNTIINFEYE